MEIRNFKVTKNNGQISVSFDTPEPPVGCASCRFEGAFFCEVTGQQFNTPGHSGAEYERPEGCPFGQSKVESEKEEDNGFLSAYAKSSDFNCFKEE